MSTSAAAIAPLIRAFPDLTLASVLRHGYTYAVMVLVPDRASMGDILQCGVRSSVRVARTLPRGDDR